MSRYKLLTEKELCEWLNISQATVKSNRSKAKRNPEKYKDRKPIPVLKIPGIGIRYREDQVNQWLEDMSAQAELESSISQRRTRRTG